MVWLVDSIQIHIHYQNKMFMVMQTMLKNENRVIFLARKSVQEWRSALSMKWTDGIALIRRTPKF